MTLIFLLIKSFKTLISALIDYREENDIKNILDNSFYHTDDLVYLYVGKTRGR